MTGEVLGSPFVAKNAPAETSRSLIVLDCRSRDDLAKLSLMSHRLHTLIRDAAKFA